MVAACTLLAGAALASACGGSSSTAAIPDGVLGEYDAVGELADVGAIGAITFLDATHYELYTTTGNDDVAEDLGTYVLDAAHGTLTLTSTETGAVQSLPFAAESVSTAVTTLGEDLRVLGGSSLTPGDGTLTGSQGTLGTTQHTVCAATIAGQSFASASPGCATQASPAPALGSTPDGGVALTACPSIGPFPSGISFKQVPDMKTSQQYVTRLGKKAVPSNPLVHTFANQGIESCFVDMNSPTDANGNAVSTSVLVSAHYTLKQIAWGATGSDRFVKLDPTAVAALEALDAASGKSLAIYSAFRSPGRQESTCASVCGGAAASGATSCARCGKKSQHMYGDAIDLTDLSLLTPTYQAMACKAGFRYVYNENNHLHVDTIWRTGNTNYCWKLNPKGLQ
jgi:hypothetical protein